MNEEVPSPCVKICVLNAQQVCTGCGRSIDEIAAWSAASSAQRQRINTQAAARRAALNTKHPITEKPSP